MPNGNYLSEQDRMLIGLRAFSDHLEGKDGFSGALETAVGLLDKAKTEEVNRHSTEMLTGLISGGDPAELSRMFPKANPQIMAGAYQNYLGEQASIRREERTEAARVAALKEQRGYEEALVREKSEALAAISQMEANQVPDEGIMEALNATFPRVAAEAFKEYVTTKRTTGLIEQGNATIKKLQSDLEEKQSKLAEQALVRSDTAGFQAYIGQALDDDELTGPEIAEARRLFPKADDAAVNSHLETLQKLAGRKKELGVTEGGKDRRLGVTEEGKNRRQGLGLDAAAERQERTIQAAEARRRAIAASAAQAKLAKMEQEYNALDEKGREEYMKKHGSELQELVKKAGR